MIHALLTLELQWQVMTPFRFLLALEFLGTRSVFVLFCFVFKKSLKGACTRPFVASVMTL